MQELVSVIIPIFNVEKYLSRCVDSVLAQTHQNLEIILVDDGSQDDCPTLCDEYAFKDERIKVIHKENGGLSDARNAGIDIAKGEWLTFVDSDDAISPIFIERLLGCVTEKGLKLAQCGYTRFELELPNEVNVLKTSLVNSKEIIENIDTATNTAAWNKIYHRSLFNSVKFPFGKIHEDVATTYKLFYQCESVGLLDGGLYYYFHNPDSITTSKIKLNKLDLIDAYKEQTEFFKDKLGYENIYADACNRLVTLFGTLISYKEENYQNYSEFYEAITKKYIELRPYMLTLPIRKDLKFFLKTNISSLWKMKAIYKIKKLLK